LRDRLRPVHARLEGHVDVVAGRAIAPPAAAARTPAPLGSDAPPNWSAAEFVDRMAALSFQTDGMMGGWDYLVGTGSAPRRVYGHMGEVLKAYSKRPMPDGRSIPVAMVRGQAPFDPLGRCCAGGARRDGCALLGRRSRARRRPCAERADQPDLFYYRNRLPNWLGGIRGIRRSSGSR
jgi:hypothetical protein